MTYTPKTILYAHGRRETLTQIPGTAHPGLFDVECPDFHCKPFRDPYFPEKAPKRRVGVHNEPEAYRMAFEHTRETGHHVRVVATIMPDRLRGERVCRRDHPIESEDLEHGVCGDCEAEDAAAADAGIDAAGDMADIARAEAHGG